MRLVIGGYMLILLKCSSIMREDYMLMRISLFPWAKFRKHKGAIKLHTLLDLRGSIPTRRVRFFDKETNNNLLDFFIQ